MVDTTYYLKPGESMQAYNTRIAAYNASKQQAQPQQQSPQQQPPAQQIQPQPQQAPPTYTPTPQPQQQPPAQQPPAQQQTPDQTQPVAQDQAPSTNLKPGQQGTDVSALQNWLIQHGYLDASQVGQGMGTYGPKTTAAVAKLQQDLGVQAGSGAGYYGPQTQQAIQQKYQTAYGQLQQSGQAPDQASAAFQAIQGATAAQQSTDPVFGSMAAMMEPIMQSLTQVMSNINNPALTGVSLQQEYNDLATQNNLPAMQSQLMNMQNVMNGTEDDIRDELTKAGGGATESQILAMSAARNKVIMKQYNSLATQYQAAQTNVQNMMQYAATDQQTQLQKQQMTASVSESLASIESQMVSMGTTMQQNAVNNLNKVVTNIGYTGLAAQAQNNPQLLSYYESLLGLQQGSLSNPETLSQLETYRQQQLQLGQQRVQIQMYNAGIGGGGTTVSSGGIDPSNPTQPQQAQVDPSTLVRPSWVPQNVPLTLSQTQMKQYMDATKGGATIDPGTNNIVAPGVGYYVQQPDGSYYLKSAVPIQTQADTAYQGMLHKVQQAQQTPVGGSPLNKGRLSRNANTALKNYIASPVYQSVANGATYLARIQAAMKDPGSISDTELADAIIKVNTGGGQVTEAQIGTYFAGQSFADKFAITGDKITGKGGVLSPQQRQDLQALAQDTFAGYKQQYEMLYVQAMQNLEGQGIPLNYGANLPDFTSLISTGQ